VNKIGEIIKSTRKQKELKQSELGRSLTVSQSYISRVECGDEMPTPMFIKLFCLLYSVEEGLFYE